MRSGSSLVAHPTEGQRLESGIFHNDPDALQDQCDKLVNLRATPEAKKKKNDLTRFESIVLYL